MRLSVSKVILFIFFIFASLELYFVSQITCSTPNPLFKSQGRRSMATLGEPYQIINKVNGKAKRRSRKQASSIVKDYNAISNDDAYYIDYHGVKTHPDPTPKHP